MIIEFTSDLKQQHIYANGNELVRIMGMDTDTKGKRITTRPETEKKHIVTFENPVLVTDNYKIGLLSPVLRDTVFALYASHKKKIIYDSTAIDFEQRLFPSVWGPSIDTLLLCRSIKYLTETNQLHNIKIATEIGSGSGFVSKYLAENNPKIEQIVLVDINNEAKKCADQNIIDPRMDAIVSGGLEYLANNKSDLVICNPPYIPRASTVEDNPYEGIGLLSGLISQSPKFLSKKGMLLVNVSSLCENKTLSLIKEMNLNYEKIDQLTVPLKVFSVLNNQSWMDFLMDNVLVKNNHEGYDYWQTLNIYKIEKKL